MNPFLVEINSQKNPFFSFFRGGEDFAKYLIGQNHILLVAGISESIKAPEIDDYDLIEEFAVNLSNSINKGVIIHIHNESYRVNIYSDLFGYSPIFYRKNGESIWLTNNIKEFDINSRKISINSTLDFLLFHYQTGSTTPYQDVSKLCGGNKLSISRSSCQQVNFSNIIDVLLKKYDPVYHCEKNLGKFLAQEIDKKSLCEFETYLTLTGGFDSRTLFAIMLSKKLNFRTVTWGASGNLQNIIANGLADKYKISHSNVYLNEDFLNSLESTIKKVVQINLDNPVLLDCPQIFYFSNQIEKSNLVTGFMGSEIIRGPSISSQTTLTEAVKMLAYSKSIDEFTQKAFEYLNSLQLFNEETLRNILPEYTKKFKRYFRPSSNPSIRALEFLFYEKNARLFSSIEKLHGNQNVINPYLNIDFIITILNQKTSYLNFKAFKTNAWIHFKFYQIYARIIKIVFPSLLNTTIDRGYKLSHLTKFIYYPFLVWFHIKNHILRRSRKKFAKPIDFNLWMKSLILPSKSEVFENQIFDKNKIESILDRYKKGDAVSEILVKKIIVLTGLHLWHIQQKE